MRGTSLEIRLLGPLDVVRDGHSLELPPSRTARALLAYLAATGRPHAREHLCDLLWEGPADPRGALRGALSKLRLLVDDAHARRLVTHGDHVSFEPGDALVDLAVVQAIASQPVEHDTPALERAAAHFRGTFVDGLDVSRCYRFDAWCTALRESTRRLHDTLLAALIERSSDAPERALSHARARLLLDPCAEAANVEVIRLLAALGRTREALEQYEACRRVLRRELGAQPSPALDALRRSLRPVRPLPAKSAGAPTRTPHAPSAPLVGRHHERAVLEEVIRARATGAVLLLAGAPGIGKTRLLAELGSIVHDAGGTVLAGRAFEAELVRPYSAWIDALRGIPSAEIPPTLRAELAPLLPELGSSASEPADRARLFEAIALLLAGRNDEAGPLVVLLDDIQWLDDASAALLHFAARRLAGTGVLVACACRRAEVDDNAATTRLLRTLRRDDALRVLELEPLGAEATAALVRGVDPQVDAARVFAECQGNPLFALELARTGRLKAHALPASLSDLIDDRLARLDRDARLVIPWAAAIGHDFDLDLLVPLTGLSTGALLSAIEQLERHGILQVTGTSYDFTHDLVRKAAYQRISEPRRRLIHRDIARALEAVGGADQELAGVVAHHAALGGEHELAGLAYLMAARRALWTFAPAEAAELAARGIRHVVELPPAQRMHLHLELLGLSIYPGMKQHRPADLEDELLLLIAEARAGGLNAEVYRGLQIIAYIHFLAGDFGGAREGTLHAQQAGRGADPATVVRAIGDAARCLGFIERDLPRAQRLVEEAAALASDIDYDGHELPQALGYVYHHNGALDEAAAAFERAAFLARNEHERWFEGISLSRLVMIEIERRRPEAALAHCRQLVAVTRNLGEGGDAPFAEALQALASRDAGDADAAARLDDAVGALRNVDSRWMVAYVQNVAACLDFENGECDAARTRAEEALEAAQLVDRRNEIAVAHALLARIALAAGDGERAVAQVAAVREYLERPGVLSARARRAVALATDALGSVDPRGG